MIIQISLPNGHATFNLQAIVDPTGLYAGGWSGPVRATSYFVDYTVAKYRKLCKLILQYADEETIYRTDVYLSKCRNAKAKEVWSSERKKHNHR